ncbi:hypothetical protein SAMN05444422_108222 [Halobiforma haloterrestris]|uniref:Uncharacterized protein n=1 Tax=Natronobacterium haloterrestre TaxID=148448 RepID=A0A1I1JAF3_NATHA|nr:hypothetical protein [Halobiforma haloterrestris]SFC45534.1 hypothetical protein SAMN05444422_108222 [Halobiforma haloterrestris]
MGEKKFTFIELHLDGDTQFGPRTLESLPFAETVIGGGEESETGTETDLEAGSSLETDREDEDESGAADEEGGSGGKAIGALVALAVLVAAGVAVRKYRGEEAETERAEEEPDVIVN